MFEPIFRIFYYNRPTLGENCNFSIRGRTPCFKKRGCSRIFLVLHCSRKYYAKQPLIKVNWVDFWKFFVSWGNFETWFISEPPSSSPKISRRKSWRSKKLCNLVFYNFCLYTFFLNAFFEKLFPLLPPQRGRWEKVNIKMDFREVGVYWNIYSTVLIYGISAFHEFCLGLGVFWAKMTELFQEFQNNWKLLSAAKFLPSIL